MPKASLLHEEKANANDSLGFLHRPAWMDPAQFYLMICYPESVTLSVRRRRTPIALE